MARYAFMDTGAGYFQGAETADSLDDAIKAYADRVGLIEEIGLALRVANVSPEQERVLSDHYDFTGMDDSEEAIAASISWSDLSDERVRSVLGFGPRE